MRILTQTAASLAAATLCLTPMAWSQGDTPQDGFAVTDLPYPGTTATATMSDGDIIAFDGTSLDEYDSTGTLLNHLLTVPSFVFPSFLLVDPTESYVLLGESSAGDLIKVDLNVPTLDVIANITFNYSAVFEDADHVLVSAAALGFGLGTQVFRVDTNTGVKTQIAQVDGSSGPVALDAAGDVYYGTVDGAFPAPLGSSSVLRWSAAQASSGVILTLADAAVVESGLDGAAAMAFDDVSGRMYLAENHFGSGANRIRVVGGGADAVLLEGANGNAISNLEFQSGGGPAELLAYQPDGAVVYYNTTDFNVVFARRSLAPVRPTANCTGPGKLGVGPFDVSYFDAPANGFSILYYNLIATLPANEVALNFKFPLFIGLSPVMLGRVPGTIPTDVNGVGTAGFVNPGGAEGLFAMQLLMFTGSGKLVGSSTLAFL